MPPFQFKGPPRGLFTSLIHQTWIWFTFLCVVSLILHLHIKRYVVSTRVCPQAPECPQVHECLPQEPLECPMPEEPAPPEPIRSPVDHYQHLHSYPVVDEEYAKSLIYHPSENAVVTAMYNDAWAVPIVTLGHTLDKVNSTARRILFYFPNRVSERALCIATASGFEPYGVERVEPPEGGVHEHFKDQFTKLTIWELDKLNVKAVVYLDADTLVRRNFDELFSLPFNFAAVPDVYIGDPGFTIAFNAGMLFIRTSSSVFQGLVSQINVAEYPHWEAEQALLNVFYGADVLRLPYIYNGNLAIKKRAPVLWEGLQAEMRIIHYTLVKPFWRGVYDEIGLEHVHDTVLQQSEQWDGLFREEILAWGEAWRETEEAHRYALTRCSWKQAHSGNEAASDDPF